MEVLYERCCGLDVHKKTVVACLSVVGRRGKREKTTRVFPFFSQASNTNLQSDFYLWPIYKFNRVHSASADRRRTRIAFFLYFDVKESNLETGKRDLR